MLRVRDLMTTDVLTVRPDMPLKKAAQTMVSAGVSGLPVTDDDGKLVGIITEADFLRLEAERLEGSERSLLDILLGREAEIPESATVGDVMTRDVVVVTPDATLAEAARIMVSKKVKRLPVVDEDGRLVAIVSRADIVAAFTRPDEVIEDEIREDILRRLMMVDPDTIEVEVRDGVVRLAGTLPTKSDVRLLEGLVRRVDGVVRVESELRWDIDDEKAAKDLGAPLP